MNTIIQTQQTDVIQIISQKIYEIRGQKVMFDFDLASLYGVETKVLNQAVKRNLRRFPIDFMFQLTKEEFKSLFETLKDAQIARFENFNNQRSQFATFDEQLTDNQQNQRSQFVTFNKIKYLPYVFTEQGISMLSSVLRSEKAIDTNIAIMRAFVALRQYALNYADLSSRLNEFMQKTNSDISEIFTVLEELTTQKKLYENRRPIGFK